MKIEEKVENAIEEIVQDLGFDVEYVEFVKEGANNILRVVVDKKNGEAMWVEDCEKVSRAIEDTVDKNIEKEYVLEVSSAGLERQLKNIKLYEKYCGSQIHIKLFKKQNDLKEFEVTLESVDKNNEIINVTTDDKKELSIYIKDIAIAYTTYDFNKILEGNTDNVNLNKLNKFNKK